MDIEGFGLTRLLAGPEVVSRAPGVRTLIRVLGCLTKIVMSMLPSIQMYLALAELSEHNRYVCT